MYVWEWVRMCVSVYVGVCVSVYVCEYVGGEWGLAVSVYV